LKVNKALKLIGIQDVNLHLREEVPAAEPAVICPVKGWTERCYLLQQVKNS